ncbi:MAG: S9 family peptidase, partial [Chloroflexi bacterium]|nr:S9 family peptidase [Chloroflexota bacterium]
RLSPDGRRLVVSVSGPAPEGTKMRSALWQIDPGGAAPPRRLTRSAAGEAGGAAFLPDGSLLFTSTRPDPDAKPDPERRIMALWQLPAGGGEARLLAAPEGGVDGLAVARETRVVAFGAGVFPGAADFAADAERGKARREAGVSALLFENDYPVRHWDHWLGPRRRRLFVAALAADPEASLPAPRDVEPDVAPSTYEETGFALSPDGRTLVAVRKDTSGLPRIVSDLVAVDVATGERRTLTPGDAWYEAPAVSPDGRLAVAVRTTVGSPTQAMESSLVLVDLGSGETRTIAADLPGWPEDPTWAPDDSAVYFTTDDGGHHPAFRVELADGTLTRLTAAGALGDLCPSPDGSTVYALWSTMATPPRVVRLDARAADQQPVPLAKGLDEGGVAAPGVVERLSARAADGTEIGSWLVRPEGASAAAPAPLVVWVHGGPIGSWSSWHWRWNPHLLVARGYAVLMPDPGISTGYGQAMVQRGWGDGGGDPFTDVEGAVDAALAGRPDLDARRIALMGGSFGGYMANWVAGQTDRYRCIVTHASLWELRGFHGTTDECAGMELEIGNPYTEPEAYARQSPSEQVGSIRTPMLVIHGEQDFRVPVSEALRLWTDLRRHAVEAKLLYFPDENHWILKPQNARLWYATVLAFLDEHVLGRPFERPELL